MNEQNSFVNDPALTPAQLVTFVISMFNRYISDGLRMIDVTPWADQPKTPIVQCACAFVGACSLQYHLIIHSGVEFDEMQSVISSGMLCTGASSKTALQYTNNADNMRPV